MGLFSGVLDVIAKPVENIIKTVAPLTGLVGTVGSYLGQQSANQANIEQSRAQMDFQERLSNTSYQRAVEDMKSAGLSPMLAYSQGGASTPAGSAARIENAVANAVSSGSQAAQTAINYASAVQTIRNQQAQEDNIDASTSQIQAQTVNEVLRSKLIPEETKRIIMDTYLKDVQARYTTALSSKEEFYLPMAKKIGEAWKSPAGTAAAYGRLIKENTPGIKAGPFEIGVK